MPLTAARRLRLPRFPRTFDFVPAALTDAAPAVVLCVAMLTERFGTEARVGGRMPFALLLTALLTAAVAVRRRAPLAAYLVATLALTAEAQLVDPSPISPYANLLGAYAVGRYGGRGRAGWGPPLVVAGVVGYFAGQDVEVVMPAGVLAVWLAVWAFGYGSAYRLAEQAAERRRARDELLAEERARIAREVHDLVGHSLNLMLVQAGAARRLIDRTPGRSRDLLAEIERTGNDALGELDRVLGLLRGTAPQLPGAAAASEPGLDELPALAERMGRAGLAVELHRDTPPLPPEQDGCAYRVVQESLTNALRHSGAGHAAVRIVRQGGATLVEVADDGAGPPPGHRPGRGLTGIAERAARLHGTAEHGPGANGGFLVRVTLPAGGAG
ncbi:MULTISPECIES: sensor histidine kinase [Kitasatospora]|uniref:histidine kinase n=1 Tax=Kitasatospora setae (strain ATCC 33774 / DSM 43861 / JCM 3304 / KCC A-0304 / NBRC 14216 / KM-6054) TaxID=452652 RepID=E4N1H6_KITSK|nr:MULTISPECIES: sensor histidine kinase [Kitasatospora]BAJ32010.1 putative two-component system sensor kinase [Kitasatospora setae KM-6054]